MIWKIIGYPLLLIVLYRMYQGFLRYLEYRALVKQGVVFPNGFNLITDTLALEKIIEKEPGTLNWGGMLKMQLKTDKLPTFVGSFLMGTPYVAITNFDALKDLYVDQAKHVTKHPTSRNALGPLMGQSIFMTCSSEAELAERRKQLSGAFYKKRLVQMCEIIKRVTLKEIQKVQGQMKEGSVEINLAEFTKSLQSQIIINILVGPKNAGRLVQFESALGEKKQITICEMIFELFYYGFDRELSPMNLLVPELSQYLLTPSDRRWGRNIQSFNQSLREMKNDVTEVDDDKQVTLLDILTGLEFYRRNETAMMHELYSFFLAGMATIQYSTMNLIYYLTANKQYKAKLISELQQLWAKCRGDLMAGLQYDDVQDLSYLIACFNESLRIEAPAAITIQSSMLQDCRIGSNKVEFKKGTIFVVLLHEVHHDPEQWRNPREFRPERFEMGKDDNEWLMKPDGLPRSPLAFTPFYGGRRVCLGKTFAEQVIRYTIPMLFHFLDFEFVSPEQKNHKETYTLEGKPVNLPFRLLMRNKA